MWAVRSGLTPHDRPPTAGEGYQQALRHVRAQEERAADVPAILEETVVRSRTVADAAFSIACVRAEEGRRPDGERLFVDPYASAFAAAGVHVAESTQRYLDLPFFRDGVRLRTRYLDDCVRDGLAAGLDQLVLLGAGFDARGLRMTEIVSRRGDRSDPTLHGKCGRPAQPRGVHVRGWSCKPLST